MTNERKEKRAEWKRMCATRRARREYQPRKNPPACARVLFVRRAVDLRAFSLQDAKREMKKVLRKETSVALLLPRTVG